MSNKNKKRILTLALVIALLSIVMVGGSLAWFTDNDSAKNTFTVGSVEIIQHEKKDDGSDFKDEEKPLVPVVRDDPTDPTDNYQAKIVTVENTGKSPAYVQTLIAVPKVLDDAGILCLKEGGSGYVKSAQGTVTVNNIEYNVYRYRYTAVLASGGKTDPSLKYVYISADTDLNAYDLDNDGEIDTGYFVKGNTEYTGFDAFDKIDVLVVTQACQSEGFADADAALNAAFPSLPDFSTVS